MGEQCGLAGFPKPPLIGEFSTEGTLACELMSAQGLIKAATRPSSAEEAEKALGLSIQASV